MPDEDVPIVLEIRGHCDNPNPMNTGDRIVVKQEGIWLMRRMAPNYAAYAGLILDGTAEPLNRSADSAMKQMSALAARGNQRKAVARKLEIVR